MLLAHGTNAHVAKNASTRGLLPRGMTGRNNWKKVPSNRKCIYLTSAYAFHYAKASSRDNLAGIVEIDTEELNPFMLWADEDALEQASRNEMAAHIPTMEARTRYFRTKLEDYALSGMGATWSLKAIGNCTHCGPIPPEAVTRVVLIRDWANPTFTMAFDPVPAILNFQILGDRYREMQKLFLGREFDMDALVGEAYQGVDRVRESYEAFVGFVEERREIIFDRGV